MTTTSYVPTSGERSFLSSRNITGNEITDYELAAGIAEQDIRAALQTGAYIDPNEVLFYVDYKKTSGNGDVDGDGKNDFKIDGVASMLYGTFDGSTGTYSNSLYAGYVTGPMTNIAALAPLLGEPAFTRPNLNNPWVSAEFAKTALERLGPQVPVPPALMQALAQWPTYGVMNAVQPGWGNSISFVEQNPWQGYASWGQQRTEQWFAFAADNNLKIDPALIDAYVKADPSRASDGIATVLANTMTADGVCNAQLMATLKSLSPNGPGGISAPPRGNTKTVDIDADANAIGFDRNPPPISGWAWIATNSALASMYAGKPVDPTLLGQLGQVNPWLVQYVTFKANTALQASLASNMTTVASGQVMGSNDVPTNVDAGIQVGINSMGRLAAVGDWLTLYVGDWQYQMPDPTDPTGKAKMPARVQLTQADIDRGFFTFTKLGLPEGNNRVTATLAPKDLLTGQPDYSKESIRTEPVTITKDLTGPSVTQASVEITSSTTAAPAPVYVYLDCADALTGLDAGDLDPTAFCVAPKQVLLTNVSYLSASTWKTANAWVDVSKAEVDGATNRVRLTLDPLDLRTAFGDDFKITSGTKVQVDYTPPASNALRDVLGNKAGAFSISGSSSTAPVFFARRQWTFAVPGQQTRFNWQNGLMNWSAYELLLSAGTEGAQAAADWKAVFVKLGLTGIEPDALKDFYARASAGTGSGGGGLPPIDPSQLDLATLVFNAFMGRMDEVHDQLQTQMDIVAQKNKAMADLNRVIGAANAIVAIVPTTATSTDPLSKTMPADRDGDTLCWNLINAMEAAGIHDHWTGDSSFDKFKRTKAELESFAQELKSQCDALGGEQQTEMIRLQTETQNYTMAAQMIATVMQKFHESCKGILDKF